jgi:UDP-2-acetamido-3-amino-2,3-dideoxy-glucuronate N-acetyltransferase
VFTNDLSPRSPRLLPVSRRYADKSWLKTTRVDPGATLGANATIAGGITIGAWAFVAAGSVVMRDVSPFTFVTGNPARPVGNVCVCAERLTVEDGEAVCDACGRSFVLREGVLAPLDSIQLWPDDPPAKLVTQIQVDGAPA